MPIYPRDRLNAMRLMKELAREGLLPKGYVRQSSQEEKKNDVSEFITLPYSRARTDFKWLSVTKPDGETVTVHVKDTEDDMERRVSRLSASLPEEE